ncbi:MAG TPA: DUF6468 domain-containing protein [Azospirillum sp.]|nr:DUF6468 domain-containing protein [Azospirillum sp.]
MSPTVSLVLDLLMVGLLVATIAYAIILNKQIVRLRESRGELAELVKGLNEAMAKADIGVRGMKQTAHQTGEGLQKAIDKAAALRDELQFMIEAGNTLADRLSGYSDDRPKPAAKPPGKTPALRPMLDEMDEERVALPPRRAAPPPSDDRPREGEEGLSRAERELLRAIENRR